MIEAAVRTFLVNSEPIRHLVGQQIYADNAPPGTDPPYIVLHITNTDVEGHLCNESSRLVSYFEIACYSTNRAQMWQIVRAVRNRLGGYRGRLDDQTETMGVVPRGGARPYRIAPVDSSTQWLYWATIEYDINYREPEPTHT